MVKTTTNKPRKVKTTTDRSIIAYNVNNRSAANCAVAAASTKTTTPNLKKLCIRKCVVKVKRIQMPSKSATSNKTNATNKTTLTNNTTLTNKTNATNKKAATPLDCTVAFQNLLRASTSTPFVKTFSGGAATIGDNVCNVSTIQPVRNFAIRIASQPKDASITTFRERIKRLAAVQEDHVTKDVQLSEEHVRKNVQLPKELVWKDVQLPNELAKEDDVQVPQEKEKANTNPNETKREKRFFHRDEPPTRTRSSITRNVYEFLSQSQIEDNVAHEDPAADIIKKMVADGKACMMTRSKTGKSRIRAVRKKLRPVGKRKQRSLRSLNEQQQLVNAKAVEQPKSPIYEQQMSPIYEPQMSPIYEPQMSPIYEPQMSPIYEPQHEDDPVHNAVAVQLPSQPDMMPLNPNTTTTEGVYSPLTRSLLLNPNKSQSSSLDRRRQLIDMARKFVSTPMQRKNPMTTTFSPIINKSKSAINSPKGGASSPWRVPDEVALPNTFVFSLNTSQLPSYSSDFIRRKHVYVPDDEPEEAVEPIVEQVEDRTVEPIVDRDLESIADTAVEGVLAPVLNTVMDRIVEPIVDSFVEPVVDTADGTSINDSNGENVPPTMTTAMPSISTSFQDHDNGNAENFVQLPNPRRTLQHRNPLKEINILDVVVLPSWKKNLQLPKTTTRNIMDNEANIMHSLRKETTAKQQTTATQQTTGKQQTPYQRQTTAEQQTPSRRQSRNLFGFEEFLNDDQDLERSNARALSQNVTLHEKLQRLMELRPTDRELPQVSTTPLRYAYDDAREPKQRNIKDMLCSTMVATPLPVHAADETTELSLFKELDPEATFDEKKPRRTYVRERAKRKRKQRVHVLFIDSDSSDNEENEQDSTDSPKKALPAQKRKRRDVEHDTKLKQFITSFNQECDEVENYSLVVE